MVEVFRELQLVLAVLQKVILALPNKSAQIIKNPVGDPLYKSVRQVPLQRVWFFLRFGLKTGIDFAHFGLESGMVYDETKHVYERNGRFVNKKEREICEFDAKFK